MMNRKQIIREEISKIKQSLSKETVTDFSLQIINRLVQTDLFQKAKCVALYFAIDNEVQTATLIEAWSDKKNIVLPVIDGDDIHFSLYTGNLNLKTGIFGIPEPASAAIITPEAIDVFVVPGIAFDHECNRLGRGKGYYDRYLAAVDKPVIGLCYDFQLVKSIPCDMHDKKMTAVITESVTVSRHHQ